ncbi:MAG: TetR family transcriptional regulator, partial [Sphingobium sp. 32-64-5]
MRVRTDDRRQAILDVATEMFREVGYARASMAAISARIGGSKGTLYGYFKSKEEL